MTLIMMMVTLVMMTVTALTMMMAAMHVTGLYELLKAMVKTMMMNLYESDWQ